VNWTDEALWPGPRYEVKRLLIERDCSYNLTVILGFEKFTCNVQSIGVNWNINDLVEVVSELEVDKPLFTGYLNEVAMKTGLDSRDPFTIEVVVTNKQIASSF
jgi:hypothetical protein